jgi:hypothetical protein
MKSILILTLFSIVFAVSINAQNQPNWDSIKWLTGEWIGEGSGQPGQGNGTFSFNTDLDGRIMIRKGHTEFPPQGNKPATEHNDLMIFYADETGNPSKAIYFDNEGHTINYQLIVTQKSVSLTSEKSANSPMFRLTYTLLDDGKFNTKFEISQDGEKFIKYLEGNSIKKN